MRHIADDKKILLFNPETGLFLTLLFYVMMLHTYHIFCPALFVLFLYVFFLLKKNGILNLQRNKPEVMNEHNRKE